MADTGLLDFFASPEGQGLLAAGFGALGSRSTLGGISRGGLLGLQAYGQASDRQAQLAQQDKHNKMLDIQLQQAQQAQQDQQDLRGLAQQFYKGPAMTMDQVNAAPGAAGPTNARAELIPQTQGSFDSQGFLNAYMAKDPLKAMQLRSSMAKELPFNKIDPKDFTSESVARFAQSGNYGDLVAARKMELTPGGQVWNPYQAQAGQAFSDPNKLFSLGADGKPVPNNALQSFELQKARAGAARTNVTVDAAPKAFWSDFGKQTSEKLFNERDAAQAAANTIGSIGELRKAVQAGSFQGAGADLKLSAAKALSSIGLQIAPNEVANSEQFNAIANGFVLDKIKGLGANPSNADREFIEKTVPRLSTDPNALPQLLNFMESKARNQVQGFNTKIRGVQQQAPQGFSPYNLEIQEPTAAQQQKTVVKTGTLNGRKVVQYSDGTTAYAD